MTLHPDTSALRLNGQHVGTLRPSEVAVMDVLIRAFPRFLTRTQMMDAVYDNRPDGDVPSATTITNTIKLLTQRLVDTAFFIECDRAQGYRLTSHEVVAAERRYREAQMPKVTTPLADISKVKAKKKPSKIRSVIASSRTASLNKKRKAARAVRSI